MRTNIDDLPKFLRNLREEINGITLRELAELSGISLSYLSDIEHGRSIPTLSTLNQIANAYGFNLVVSLEINKGDDNEG